MAQSLYLKVYKVRSISRYKLRNMPEDKSDSIKPGFISGNTASVYSRKALFTMWKLKVALDSLSCSLNSEVGLDLFISHSQPAVIAPAFVASTCSFDVGDPWCYGLQVVQNTCSPFLELHKLVQLNEAPPSRTEAQLLFVLKSHLSKEKL